MSHRRFSRLGRRIVSGVARRFWLSIALGLMAMPALAFAQEPTPSPIEPPIATVRATPAPSTIEAEVTFTPSRQTLNVGDAWSVTGEITNRSRERPIWIIDTRTVLLVAPEVFGEEAGRFGLSAAFPTVVYGIDPIGDHDHVVRIEPGSKYAVLWWWKSDDLLRGPIRHAFFSPGPYRATAVVHYWLQEPDIKEETERLPPSRSAPASPTPIATQNDSTPSDTRQARRVQNLAASATFTSTRDIAFDASLTVLLVGAAIGGILAMSLRASMREQPLPPLPDEFGHLKRFGANVVAAVLLPVVATLLLARLAASDAPIAIQVRDLWGAIATGFVVQWSGLPWLMSTLGRFGATERPDAKPKPNDPRVTPAPAATEPPPSVQPLASAEPSNDTQSPGGPPTGAVTKSAPPA